MDISQGNNTGLPPVPFHAHFPIHTLKFTDTAFEIKTINDKKILCKA